MAKKRMNGFTFYGSYYDAIAEIKNDDELTEEAKNDKIAKLFLGICGYMFEGKEPEFKGMTKSTYLAIKPNLDSSIKKHENGQKGANAKQTQGDPQEEDGDSEQDDDEIQADDKQDDSEPQADTEQTDSKDKQSESKQKQTDSKIKQTPSKTKTNTNSLFVNNKNNLLPNARGDWKCTREDFIRTHSIHFEDLLEIHKKSEFGKTAREIIGYLADACVTAQTSSGLKFNKKTIAINDLLFMLRDISCDQFAKIVTTIHNWDKAHSGTEQELRDRPRYVLGMIFNMCGRAVGA